MDWLPIESAPKDKTEVDLWMVDEQGAGSRLPDAYWGKGWDGKLRVDREGWVAANQDYDMYGLCDIWATPTHWMPIPPPPAGLPSHD